MSGLLSEELKLYSNVKETSVDWLWYPYIPFGKLTMLNGDPGNGKSTLMMNLIAAVSRGGSVPGGGQLSKPMHVIYQCSEDGVSDTIKPRLLAAGADCSNVAFIDEDLCSITLNDEKLRRAMADFHAKLLVLDPVQAYIGDADLSNAGGMRRVLRQLSLWASMYECAVVLIGHLNKKQGARDLYRSLGSIDLVAAARSVMQIDCSETDADIRILRHVKSSLSRKGDDLYFTIDGSNGIHWLSQAEALENTPPDSGYRESKQGQTAALLYEFLRSGPVRASQILSMFKSEKISERTVNITKKQLGIQSFKKEGIWFWRLPGNWESEDAER